MTRAQLERFDRAAQALLDLTEPMSPADISAVLAEFLAGRSDITVEDIDALCSRAVRAKLAQRIGAAA
ncbi:hypothetical protein P6F26_16670 [Roseibacterium sp. SDUM158017]|uniref:hypothetical protein n=1 Tax=Roseicyclus salinarum TaxID=3036773 RepID=UPI00241507A4|nr:hypothetical protein [Roseibacterium sp. SDUM158017]MDG4650083.1 hypothetical protein [Roseibacterium sp. SDUM158017]